MDSNNPYSRENGQNLAQYNRNRRNPALCDFFSLESNNPDFDEYGNCRQIPASIVKIWKQ